MKESFWGVFIISMGLIGIAFVFLFQNITNTDEHNMQLLKETTEAAMYDAVDLGAYRKDGTVKIMKYPVPFYANNNTELQKILALYLFSGIIKMDKERQKTSGGTKIWKEQSKHGSWEKSQ